MQCVCGELVGAVCCVLMREGAVLRCAMRVVARVTCGVRSCETAEELSVWTMSVLWAWVAMRLPGARDDTRAELRGANFATTVQNGRFSTTLHK